MTGTADRPISEFELLEIGYATEDHAARYFGGPMCLGVEDSARYVTEGHLGHLAELYGFGRVWDAVADFIAGNPEVLGRNERQRADRQVERQATAAELRRDAKRCFNRSEFDRAETLILAAKRLDPQFGGFGSIRDRIAAGRAGSGA